MTPDKQIARALQFLLEYNLVRPNRNVPRHIRRVFRDVSELPTMESLDAGILDALDNSECLFVICSPELSKSKYCLREIRYFKELHGGSLDRISTLLVRGEPAQAYPPELCTSTEPDPADPSRTREREVEPLFADVRSRTLPGSLWKLAFSEYLRMASQYYRCAYDDLKKRHRRNLAAFLLGVVLLLGGVTGALALKEHQVEKTVADSYAAYASEQVLAEDELLALALCTHRQCLDTQAFQTALRSAVVQLDYKQNAVPVTQTMQTDYFHGNLTIYYLSAGDTKLVLADDNIWQIIDARNGRVLEQLAYESAYVRGTRPSVYVKTESRPDGSGIFHDHMLLVDIETNAVILDHPFRKSGTDRPNYDLAVQLGAENYMVLLDNQTPVVFFTDTGEILTQEEFVRRAKAQIENSAEEDQPPFYIVRDRRQNTYAVKDAQGNLLLDLGSECRMWEYTRDHSLLAAVTERVMTVYETRTWTPVHQVTLESGDLQSLHLLQGSSYFVAGYRMGSETLSCVCDWRTGEQFLSTMGTVLPAESERAFYTITDGTVSRYDYNDLQTDQRGRVLAHWENRCLIQQEDRRLLLQTDSGNVLLDIQAAQVLWDETLEHFLIRREDSLQFCDSGGNLRWEMPCRSTAAAISPDGAYILWMDGDGSLYLHQAADGAFLSQRTTEGLGPVESLVCSDAGVGIFSHSGALWAPHGEQARYLGPYSQGTLFSDGRLILENRDRIQDFLVYDTQKDRICTGITDCTGTWTYSPGTATLVRHVEGTGGRPQLYLQIWDCRNTEMKLLEQVDLPDNHVEGLRLDSTGQILSLTCGGRSRILHLQQDRELLDAAGSLYYEGDCLYGWQVYGQYQYRMPMHDTQWLLQWAREALVSPVSTRTLTPEEIKLYATDNQ